MTTTETKTPSATQEALFVRDICRLLKSLKRDIGDDYRASDDPDDNPPGMQVTVGGTIAEDGTINWHYQTGDNSYSGGAYSHAYWGVISLYRRSNSMELAKDISNQILEQAAQ